jgi:protease-4
VQLLWQAADDPRVVGLYVELGDEEGGMARVQELRQAIAHFRGKGKFAVGFAESLGSGGTHVADYYLAAALDQIWLQPSGGFSVTGIAVETPFLKGGLDKLGVKVEGGKRYEYKSAPDSFMETSYTRPARENLQQLIDSLFGQFIADVARDRKMEAGQLRRLIDTAPHESEQARRDGLVDKIGYRTDALEEVYQRANSKRDLVTLAEYAGDETRPKASGEVIALVRASGAIASGTGTGNPLEDEAMANSDDVVEALENAAEAKDVRAIVLRIDSPGGTYPAADAIADAVGRARAAGKPVIVSMGDVAASGGYLAAVRGDVIVAQPTTITASIGVFTIWPMAQELLTSLGINVERVSVGRNAGMHSTFQPPTPAQRAAVNRELDVIYAAFTAQVAESRNLDANRIDAAARGRVFSGHRRQARRSRGRAGRPAAGAQHRQGKGRHRRGSQGRDSPLSRRIRSPAALHRSPVQAGGCHGVPEPRGYRAKCARRWRSSAWRRAPVTSACRPCRRSGASAVHRGARRSPSCAQADAGQRFEPVVRSPQ